MTTFVKINIGDKVFIHPEYTTGKVVEIHGNEAEIYTENDTLELHPLHNLTKLKEEEEGEKMKIKIKYFNSNLTKINKINQGDWIDLRSAVDVELKAGEFKLIPLGVAMKLPENYEAPVIPRSSTFKNYGVIQTNSYGLIDNSYSGNEDQWHFPAYATRDTKINFNDRICQFRIQKRMEEVEFEEVFELDEVSRGGFGSTGIN